MYVDTAEEVARVQQLLEGTDRKINAEALSTLLKNQAGPDYDPYRLGGMINSFLSFAIYYGEAYATNRTINLLDTVLKE